MGSTDIIPHCSPVLIQRKGMSYLQLFSKIIIKSY